MSDPFLTLPGTKRKRATQPDKGSLKRQEDKRKNITKRRLRDISPQSESGEEIGPGIIDSDVDVPLDEPETDDEESADETPAERRLRLAKAYLEKVKLEVGAEYDAAEIDRDIIAQRLQEDVAEAKGKVYKHIACSLSLRSIEKPVYHKEVVTGVIQYGTHFYTTCKNGIIEKWDMKDIRSLRRIARIVRVKDKRVLTGHTDDVLCLTISGDGKYLATGGKDKRICIWDASTVGHLKTFTQHRGAVMGLACRLSTNQLYSTSADRTLKLWSLNDLMYIETLFGHQDAIPAVAAFTQERCVSVGARDRSARVWKIVEETQLVYQSPTDKQPSSMSREQIFPEGSMDCVAVIDEQHFVTGSDNGDIVLWGLNKKKPLFVKRLAHGMDEPVPPERITAESVPDAVEVPVQPRWITCVATLPYTDLFISGSWDGKIGIWRVTEDLRKFELLQYVGIGVNGIINGISIDELGKRGIDGVRVVVAVGSELRLGRWKVVKGGRNCAVIVDFGLMASKK